VGYGVVLHGIVGEVSVWGMGERICDCWHSGLVNSSNIVWVGFMGCLFCFLVDWVVVIDVSYVVERSYTHLGVV